MGWTGNFYHRGIIAADDNKKIIKDGVLFSGEAVFFLKSKGDNNIYRFPTSGSYNYVDGYYSGVNPSTGNTFNPSLETTTLNITSLELDSINYSVAEENNNSVYQQMDSNSDIRLFRHKDLYVVNNLVYADAFAVEFSVHTTATDFPSNVPVILSIDGSDKQTQYVAGGICDVSYIGDAISWSLRFGQDGDEIANGLFASPGTYSKSYNITSEKRQRSIDNFLINENNGVKLIQNLTAFDIAKAEIITL